MTFENAQWRKSSRSGSSNCVELAPVATQVAARDSQRPAQTPLAIDRRAWSAFAHATRIGRYDLG